MKSFKDFLNEGLTAQQRLQRSLIAKKNSAKAEAGRRTSGTKAATMDTMKKRAKINARYAAKTAIAGGKNSTSINPSTRSNVEKRTISLGAQTATKTRQGISKQQKLQYKRLS